MTLLYELTNHHSVMIDVMVPVPARNWMLSIGRDKNIIVWKFYKDRLIKPLGPSQYLLRY